MDHKGTIRIETQRLLLRPFSMEDAASAFRNWMGDENVTEFLRWKPHRNVEETKDNIDRKNISMVSRLLSDTCALGLIYVSPDSTSDKNRKYLPFWA